MVLKDRLNEFWEKEIKPRFAENTLNYQVTLLGGRSVRYVNLDNAATTTPFLRVTKELGRELWEYGSVHRGAGEKSKISTKRYEEARRTVRGFVNGKSDDYVVFTSNTTIGMNQLAYFFAYVKGKVMVSDIEHSSSYLPWVFQEGLKRTPEQVSLEDVLTGKNQDLNDKILERGQKQVIKYKTNEDFSFDLGDIGRILSEQRLKGEDERVKVLIVTGASNVTGYKPPLKELADMAHKYNAMIVVDGCQLLQHEKVGMQKQGLDFVVFSGHKMYAPFGGGAIVGNKKILDAFWPYQMGGGNFPYITNEGGVIRDKKEGAHEPGSPNFAGARAIHHAIKEFEKIGLGRIAWYEHKLVEYAFNELQKIDKVKLYVKRNPKGTFDRSLITFNIQGFSPDMVANVLNNFYGIGVRAGSYCVYEFSRRINNITAEEDKKIAEKVRKGIKDEIPGSVRASFSIYNNIEDADRLILGVKEMIQKGPDYYIYMH